MKTQDQLDGFLKTQRLAIQCAQDIAQDIRPGITEKKVASLMDTYLQDQGVRTFFHKSFAWFGNRTKFDGFKNYFHFLPSKRELQENDVVILDTAPILDGYPADIGYTYSLNPQPELKAAIAFLKKLRDLIPNLFETVNNTAEIWQTIDQLIQDEGYENAHSKYPFSVLGHKLHYTPLYKLPGLTIPFSLHAYVSILGRGLMPELLGPKNSAAKEGLWAIEPHLGVPGAESFGAKFEEILVFENGKANWLESKEVHLV